MKTPSNHTKWLVIVNPNAGGKKGAKDWKKISRLLNKYRFNYVQIFTKHPLHAIEITCKHIEKGVRNIIVVGGDGTLNEVVNGVFKQKATTPNEITIGVISVGTGNDWRRTFAIPNDYEKAIKIILKGETLLQDVGKVSYIKKEEKKERYFINMCGLGFDAYVAKRTNIYKEKGRSNLFIYLYNLVIGLFNYKPFSVSIDGDNDNVNVNLYSMVVAICKFNGGGMKQTPDAIPNDGLFDICVVKNVSKLFIIRNIHKLYNGTFSLLAPVINFKSENVVINSNNNLYAEIDGESIGHSPFEFSIFKRILTVIVNKEGDSF